MAKKTSDKKNKEVKTKKTSSKPKVEKKVEPVVENNDIFDIVDEQHAEFATKDDLFVETANNQEDVLSTGNIDTTVESEQNITNEEKIIVDIEEIQLDPEIFRGSTYEDTLVKASELTAKTENSNLKRVLNGESSQYEELPLKPMKRDPKNIFFKVKKKIKMIFE